MKRNRYLYILIILMLIIGFLNAKTTRDKSFAETVALTRIRNIGHLILYSIGDSVSRVMPIEKIKNAYKINFENSFRPNPDSLLLISMQQLKGQGEYALELWEKDTNKMIYSFIVANTETQTILPCLNRPLPKSKYQVIIRFAKVENNFYLMFGATLLLILAAGWMIYKNQSKKTESVYQPDLSFISIGRIKFYPDKQKLIIDNTVIVLTDKENQVLRLLANSSNQVVERNKLQKEIWEDQGVIVARSLDIFVSRLRKKLSVDSTVKIVNIHGKGYKLETNE